MVDMRKQYFSPISWHEKDKLKNSNFPYPNCSMSTKAAEVCRKYLKTAKGP